MSAITRRMEALKQESISSAYARLARYYDLVFGPLLGSARNAAIRAVNALPGRDVLEVGVGTGLALPKYRSEKRITGIDMSCEMLMKARQRTAERELANVEALLEMDAQATGFADGRFDIAVAMFVASVVPDPRALLKEMRRVVKPGGTLLFVNHFARTNGPAWWQDFAATATARLGWRGDFRPEDIFDASDLARASRVPQIPLGLFQLVTLPRGEA